MTPGLTMFDLMVQLNAGEEDAGLREFTRAMGEDLAPLRTVLERIYQATDEEMESVMAEVEEGFPDLAEQVLASDAGTEALLRIIASAWLEEIEPEEQ